VFVLRVSVLAIIPLFSLCARLVGVNVTSLAQNSENELMNVCVYTHTHTHIYIYIHIHNFHDTQDARAIQQMVKVQMKSFLWLP